MRKMNRHEAVTSSVVVLGMLAATTVARATPIESLQIFRVDFRNALSIKRDVGGQTTYLTPHWLRNRATQAPILQKVSSKVQVDTWSNVSPTNAAPNDGDFYLRGSAGPYIFYQRAGSSDEDYESLPSWIKIGKSPNLPAYIRPGDPFNITWKWTQDKGDHWADAGSSESDATSSNRMYVALGSTGNFHSVVDVSCKNGANASGTGSEYQTAVFQKIWEGFATLDIPRAQDGSTLSYYLTGNGKEQTSSTVSSLVHDADGHCDAWQGFFMEALGLQDIPSQRVQVTPVHRDGFDAGLKIKTTIAQGNSNAPDQFWFHTLVTSSAGQPGALYDPSYGVAALGSSTISPQVDWENRSLEATLYNDQHDATLPPVVVKHIKDAKDCIYTNG